MAWRLATSIEVLRKEVNAARPNRSKATDGTIGDVAHQNQGSGSDHNPWLNNTVRAWDITTADFTDTLAEWLRLKGKAGDPRLVGGGMVIYQGRIASDNGDWEWRRYGGSDPHTSHIHLSVTRNPAYDSNAPWGVAEALGSVLTPTEGAFLLSAEFDAIQAHLNAINDFLGLRLSETLNRLDARFNALGPRLDEILAESKEDGTADVDVTALATRLADAIGPTVARELGEALVKGAA